MMTFGDLKGSHWTPTDARGAARFEPSMSYTDVQRRDRSPNNGFVRASELVEE